MFPQCVSLFGHPRSVLEGQFSAADLLLAQINVLPELGYGIQGSVVLETQTADLEGKRDDGIQNKFPLDKIVQ